MLEDLLKKFHGIYIFIFLLCIYALYISVSWIPAVEGDGVMLPQAIALAEGKLLYLDIFEQYGTLVPLIQFPFLKIFGYKIIVIRYVGMVIILLIALLTYLIISEISSKKVATLSSLLVISTQPSWNVFNNKTWPIENLVWFNSYGLLFYLLTFYILIKIKTKDDNRTYILIALAAVASFLGANARVDLILPNLFFLTYVLFLTNYKKRIKYIYFEATAFCYITLTIFLIKTKTLNNLFEQLFLPTLNGDNKVVFSAPLEFYLKSIFTQIVACAILFSLLYFTFSKITNDKSQVLFMVLFLFIITLFSTDLINNLNLPRKINSFVYLVTSDFILTYITLLILLSIFLVINLILRKKLNTTDLHGGHSKILYYCFPLTLLPTMHNLSLFYQYMIFIPFLISFLHFVESNFKSKTVTYSRIISLLSSFAISLIICSTSIFFVAKSKMTYIYEYPTLQGMVDSDKNYREVIESHLFYIDKLVKDKNLSIDCTAALFSVSKKGYIVNSKYPSLVVSKTHNFLKDSYNDVNTIHLLCGISDEDLDNLIRIGNIKILAKLPYFENNLSVFYTKLS